METPWVPTRVLITVRTYPAPSQKYVEISCTAGVTSDGRLIRIYPLPYRLLPEEQKFSKWQWMEVNLRKAQRDPRPESNNPERNSIRIVSDVLPTVSNWRARRDILTPLQARSMCSLQEQQQANGYPTLGFFSPKIITGLVIKKEAEHWSERQEAVLRQTSMFQTLPKEELEKIPYTFSYRYRCDDETCTTQHEMSCTDWEMGQSYRQWKKDYGKDWEKAFRKRYEEEMIQRNDTHFFVGTLSDYPKSWIIVGLFYPPKTQQGELF